MYILQTVIQWNPSNPDTIGPEESVLIREVSLFQGLKSTHTWYLGDEKCVLFREVSYFRGVLIEGLLTVIRLSDIIMTSSVGDFRNLPPMTLNLDMAAQHHRTVIGSGGGNIRKIMEETGTT